METSKLKEVGGWLGEKDGAITYEQYMSGKIMRVLYTPEELEHMVARCIRVAFGVRFLKFGVALQC
jgi:hypothetical protein